MTAIETMYESYFKKPQEGEIDLVSLVKEILKESGLAMQIQTAYDSNTHIQQAIGKNVEAQRYLLNRYWNLQMLSCSDFSFEERQCLIPNGTIEDWIRLFKAKIIPFCIKNNLPKVI